ncbi:MAG: hypothetical protein JNL11_03885 [Bdellovibrionaceae bacterium]|nr:hypothetical protein [Pseudobdellovibrionaceae bacterium]
MQIDKLSSFNKRFFKKILGLHISQKRREMCRSYEDVSLATGLSPRVLRMIETGHKNLSQEQFDFFISYFELDSNSLIEMSRITHVQYLMSLYKEIDENYPA